MVQVSSTHAHLLYFLGSSESDLTETQATWLRQVIIPNPLVKNMNITCKNSHILPTGQWYAPSAVNYSAQSCTILHCLSLSCTILHYLALSCTNLHYLALSCTTLRYLALSCSILRYLALSCTILHHLALSCAILHYFAL